MSKQTKRQVALIEDGDNEGQEQDLNERMNERAQEAITNYESKMPDTKAVIEKLKDEFQIIGYLNGTRRFVDRESFERLLTILNLAIEQRNEWIKDACSTTIHVTPKLADNMIFFENDALLQAARTTESKQSKK